MPVKVYVNRAFPVKVYANRAYQYVPFWGSGRVEIRVAQKYIEKKNSECFRVEAGPGNGLVLRPLKEELYNNVQCRHVPVLFNLISLPLPKGFCLPELG